MNTDTPPRLNERPRAGWRQVTQAQFYEGIGNRDVHPSILPGPYPYTSEFKTRDGRTVVGVIAGYRIEGPGLAESAYYLPA